MRRSGVNGKDVFREATDAYARDLEAELRQQRHEMEGAWEEIDEGWAALEAKMNILGFRPVENMADSMLKLNVGGAPVDLWRSSLIQSEHARQSKLGNLFNGVWDKRLPVTSNGRIVLDESPSCFKHLMNALLEKERSSTRHGTFSASNHTSLEVVDPCDRAYMESFERFLELDVREPEAMVVSGGSKILVGTEGRVMLRQLKSWLTSTGSTGMNLLYQASRDGFNATSFHKCCDGAGSTVTLFEVCSESQSSQRKSVVGGFSGTSWAPSDDDNEIHGYKESPGSFIFLLKDGKCRASPKNWVVERDYDYDNYNGDLYGYQAAVCCLSTHGPQFGIFSLSSGARDIGMDRSLCVRDTTYQHKGDNSSAAEAFRALNGARADEIEVYSLHITPSATPSSSANQRSVAPRHFKTFSDDADTRLFGTSITGCLARERHLLNDAEIELAEANAMVEATANALKDIYGPHVAAGVEDPVVELNVRGRSFTTLLSTLQACPDSALSTRFNSERWVPSERDLDSHGRHVMDCDPVCFSKILDVLRIRKRASWSPTAQSKEVGSSKGEVGKGNDYPVRVVVPRTLEESFSALVDMFFPGNCGFITDLVNYQSSAVERNLNDRRNPGNLQLRYVLSSCIPKLTFASTGERFRPLR